MSFPSDFTGEGEMRGRGYPYRPGVWHARSKDGVDRFSALPDELLSLIFDLSTGHGRLPRPLNLSRRLLRFSRQLFYESLAIREWADFRLFVRTITGPSGAELGALVRVLGLLCEGPLGASEVAFASGEERVLFWKRLGGVRQLEVTAEGNVLPTMEELEGFGEGEVLGRVAKARVAGEWVGWEGRETVNSWRNLLKMAPNITALDIWVGDKAISAAAHNDGPSTGACPLVTELDIRGHLSRGGTPATTLLGAFPNLTKLVLKELEPGRSVDDLVDALDLPKLESLHLAATGATDEPQHNGHVFYFGWQPPEDPPPPLTASLAKFTSLKRLQLDCSSSPSLLLTLPKTLAYFKAGEHAAVTLPVLTRLLDPSSLHHLPNLKTFHSEFQPDELQGEHMWGLQLGRARIPYLPVLENGEPDFALRGFWDFAPRFPQQGEWTFDTFERLVRLAQARDVDLGDTPLMFPFLCETKRREELVVRADLKRRWEAGELVWRKDTKDVARTIGYQKQTGETPEPEPYRSRKRVPGTRPEGVRPTKNRKRHRKSRQ